MPVGWVAAGATVLGAVVQSNAASDAADSQSQSAANALASNERIDSLNRADRAPWREAGVKYLGLLGSEIDKGVNPQDVMNEPGYQFGRQQGQLGIDRKIAASGGRVSGAAIKRSAEYNNDYASGQYGAAYNRQQDRLNRLATLAQIGQVAPTNAQAGNAGIIQGAGNAAAAGQLAQGNIWGNAANQLGAAGQRWASQPSGGFDISPGAGGGTNGNGGYVNNGVNYNNPSAF